MTTFGPTISRVKYDKFIIDNTMRVTYNHRQIQSVISFESKRILFFTLIKDNYSLQCIIYKFE